MSRTALWLPLWLDLLRGTSNSSFYLCYQVSGLNEQHCQNNRWTLAIPSVDHWTFSSPILVIRREFRRSKLVQIGDFSLRFQMKCLGDRRIYLQRFQSRIAANQSPRDFICDFACFSNFMFDGFFFIIIIYEFQNSFIETSQGVELFPECNLVLGEFIL